MMVRRYESRDWGELYRMTQALFPGTSTESEAAELRGSLTRPDGAVFVLDRGDGTLGGYVEAGERGITDQCETSPVGYIEAWYVDPDLRRSGHGRALIDAAEQWGRERGYVEMGSDALLDNVVSHEAHKRLGYEEAERIVEFRKVIGRKPAMRNVRQAVPFFMVRDMDRSVDFYVNGIGARITTRWEVDGKLRWCSMLIGDAALMLQEYALDDARRAEKLGAGVSICFICNDAICFYKEVTSRGVKAARPFVGNSMWVTELADPDGYALFFESNTDAPEESVYIP